MLRAALLMGLFAAPLAWAQQPTTEPSGGVDVVRGEARRLIDRGAEYLVAAQEADGGWASKTGPGISSLVLKALIQAPKTGPNHPAVKRGLEFVFRFQRDDGGIYSPEGLLKNYESSVALSMISALPEDPSRNDRLKALRKYLIDLQWDEGEGKSVDDPWHGGAGYGNGKRPDLSNTQMMLEALHDSGLPKEDPAFQKALVFIARCQMLGETNDQTFAKGSKDGGFIYSCANHGESKAGEWEVNGRKELRTYGTMTYAGFKSMLYAGLRRDDPRVKAAMDWIARNWTLDRNPNMPEKQSHEGLFYYFHVFARAMAAWGQPIVQDPFDHQHDWRRELVDKLAQLQRQDGSWVNEHDRWMEGLPPLTTAYALLALEAAVEEPPRAQ